MPSTILFATSNPDKAVEVEKILSRYGVKVEILKIRKPEIQSDSLERIAGFSAKILSRKTSKALIVEDTGLFIEALNGFPGPYSAYVYRTIGLKGILRLMEGVVDRRAVFRCVVAYCEPQGKPKLFVGETYGLISTKEKGGGWGYDPIFKPEGYCKTYGELGEEKNIVSHRAKAFRRFAEWYTFRRKE